MNGRLYGARFHVSAIRPKDEADSPYRVKLMTPSEDGCDMTGKGETDRTVRIGLFARTIMVRR